MYQFLWRAGAFDDDDDDLAFDEGNAEFAAEIREYADDDDDEFEDDERIGLNNSPTVNRPVALAAVQTTPPARAPKAKAASAKTAPVNPVKTPAPGIAVKKTPAKPSAAKVAAKKKK